MQQIVLFNYANVVYLAVVEYGHYFLPYQLVCRNIKFSLSLKYLCFLHFNAV